MNGTDNYLRMETVNPAAWRGLGLMGYILDEKTCAGISKLKISSTSGMCAPPPLTWTLLTFFYSDEVFVPIAPRSSNMLVSFFPTIIRGTCRCAASCENTVAWIVHIFERKWTVHFIRISILTVAALRRKCTAKTSYIKSLRPIIVAKQKDIIVFSKLRSAYFQNRLISLVLEFWVLWGESWTLLQNHKRWRIIHVSIC